MVTVIVRRYVLDVDAVPLSISMHRGFSNITDCFSNPFTTLSVPVDCNGYTQTNLENPTENLAVLLFSFCERIDMINVVSTQRFFDCLNWRHQSFLLFSLRVYNQRNS